MSIVNYNVTVGSTMVPCQCLQKRKKYDSRSPETCKLEKIRTMPAPSRTPSTSRT